MKRVIIPIENYELDDYKVHKDGMKDYAYLILLISRKLISFPHLSEENSSGTRIFLRWSRY